MRLPVSLRGIRSCRVDAVNSWDVLLSASRIKRSRSFNQIERYSLTSRVRKTIPPFLRLATSFLMFTTSPLISATKRPCSSLPTSDNKRLACFTSAASGPDKKSYQGAGMRRSLVDHLLEQIDSKRFVCTVLCNLYLRYIIFQFVEVNPI